MQRLVNRRSLPHACKILLQRRTRDNANAEYVTSYTPIDDAVAIPARVTPAELPIELVSADQISALSRVYVTFDAGTDIPPTARLFVTGVTNTRAWEMLLEILSPYRPRSSSSLSRYLCARVNEARK